MKIRIFFILIGLLFIAGCSQERLNEQHEQYLSNKGWHIKEPIKVETHILEIPNEILSNYEASGITFLGEYLGKKVTEHSYELKEKDIGGNRLKAVVFESDGEMIGGYGILPSWTPGIFNLDDKERLINEGMIK